MDVNTTLADLRGLIDAVNELGGENTPDYTVDMIAEKFTALHEWLSKGGFLPDEWQR